MENQTTNESQARSILLPRLPLSTEDSELLATWNSDRRILPDLTDEEKKKVIEAARYQKGLNLYKAAYANKVTASPEYPKFTASEFYDILLDIGAARAKDQGWANGFIVDGANKSILKMLSLYFTDDSRFSSQGNNFSLAKGLLLTGPVGCGKTQTLNLCTDNQKQVYRQANCIDIAREYTNKETGGDRVIDLYSYPLPIRSHGGSFGHKHYGLFFDDLAAETNAKHFGNERNVMEAIIQTRYSVMSHTMTHFSSNLSMADIGDFYGPRVADRLREMCNVIEYPSNAKSLRT